MLYRIRLDLAFPDEADRHDIFDKALDALEKAVTIQPGQPEEEPGFITLEDCYHDETPPQPCVVTEEHHT